MQEAWCLEGGFGLENLKRITRDMAPLGAHDVRIRVRAASYNFRDLVVLAGKHGKAVQPPLVPLSDGVGVVDAIGEGVKDIAIGDRVCPIFFQHWLGGQPPADLYAGSLGGPIDGMLASHRTFPAQSVVKVPAHLTDAEAAALPCAGVTAWSALSRPSVLRPGETVLILGTGGVALFALQFAKTAGARVIMTTSSDEKSERLQSLGADHVINRATTPDWGAEVLALTDGIGVDRVIELGGAATLNTSVMVTRPGGSVILIGNVTGSKAELFLPLVLTRQIGLQAVTVGSKQDFTAMCRAMEMFKIHPIVDRVFDFEEADEGFAALKNGGHFGNLVIKTP